MNKYGEIGDGGYLTLKFKLPSCARKRYRLYEKMENYFAGFGYDVFYVNPPKYRIIQNRAWLDAEAESDLFMQGVRW